MRIGSGRGGGLIARRREWKRIRKWIVLLLLLLLRWNPIGAAFGEGLLVMNGVLWLSGVGILDGGGVDAGGFLMERRRFGMSGSERGIEWRI